ncbi:MAG TPA: methyl-accepting chemotaxis protein, partial [bacterium]|nr:methyl-accepting chemotaxis protein [bacterium]
SSADKGSQVIDETVDGMQKMLAMVQQSSNVVNSLSESSRKITKVVSIIDDITKQVNLIALNASIEATRAGEKGKGFAVVADEIKKLAERTAHSTTEINDIISKIQVNVNEAVNLMGRSNEEAANGIRLSQEAKSSLKEISDVFKNVTMMVSQVAVSSQEQSVTGDQITDNVKVINTATQQIAGGINEIAKSAEYLNNLTTTLQKTVKRFKIGD